MNRLRSTTSHKFCCHQKNYSFVFSSPEMLASMDFGGWSLRIFDNFSTNFNGGVFRALAQSNSSGAFVPPGFVQSWLMEVISKPSYNFSIAILVLWGAFIPIFGGILLCRFCSRYSSRCRKCTLPVEICFDKYAVRATEYKLKKQCCSPKKRAYAFAKWFKDISINLSVVVISLLIFFVLLHFSMLGGSRLIDYMTDSNSSTSLNATIDKTIFYSKQFLVNGIKSANSTTGLIVNNLQKEILLIMGEFISAFLKQMFKDTGVSDTFNRAGQTLKDIVNLTNDMDTIHQSRIPLTKHIDEFRGSVKSLQPLVLEIFQGLCDTGSSTFRQQCSQLQLDTQKLTNSFSAQDVDFDGSTAATTFLKASKINVEGIFKSFVQSQSQLSGMTEKIKNEVLSLMPMEVFTKSLTGLWTSVEKEVEKNVITPIDQFRSANPIQSISIQINGIWVILFGIAWTLLLIFSIVTLSFVILIIAGIIRKEWRRKYPTFSHTNPSLPVELSVQDNFVILRGTTYLYNTMTVFHCLWGLLTAVCFLVLVFLFCLSGITSSETCRYVVTPDGVRIADPLVDKIVLREWNRLVATANLSQVPITLKPPQHILLTLYSCSNNSTAILPALSMTGMLNFSHLPNLPQFASLIDQGRAMIDKNLNKMDLDSLMPTKYVADMELAVRFLETFAKKKNFSQSIAALKKPLFVLEDFKGYVERIDEFYNSYSASNAQIRNSRSVISTLKQSVDTFDRLKIQRANVSNAFQNLETFANLSVSFKKLIAETQETMGNLKNKTYLSATIDKAYKISMQPVTVKLIEAVETNFHQFETSTFMCYDLHLAFLHFTNGMCGQLRGDLNFTTIHFFFNLIGYQILYTFFWKLLYCLERRVL